MKVPGVGEALQIAGNALMDMGQTERAYQRVQDEHMLTQAKTESFTRLTNLLTEVETEADPQRIRSIWTQGLEGLERDMGERLAQRPGVLEAWRYGFTEDRARLGQRVEKHAHGLTLERGRAALDTELEGYRSALVGAGAQDIEAIRGKGLGAIERKVQMGLLTEEEGQEKRRSFQGFIDTYQVERDITSAPDRALAALQGDEAYGGLDAVRREHYTRFARNQVHAAKRRVEQERREAEREREQLQRDRIAVLSSDLEDSLSSVLETGTSMPETAGMIAELSRQGRRGAEMADEYRQRFGLIDTAWAVVAENRFQPFAEQMRAVESLKPEPGSRGYKARMAVYEHAAKLVHTNAKAFDKDPAAFVAGEVMRRAQASGIDPQREPLRGVRVSMDLQRELGAVQPQVFPKHMAADLRAKFEAADAAGKIGLVGALDQYGEFKPQALAELKLSPQHHFAASLASVVERPLAEKVMRVADMKPQDIGLDSDSAREVRRTVNSDFYESGMGAVLRAQVQLTGQPKYAAQAKALEDLTVKLALAEGDAPQAMEELWDRFATVVDDDFGAVWMPPGVDADLVEDRLTTYRAQLRPEEIDYGALGMLGTDLTRCVWKNSADGTGFALMDPVTGTVLSRGGEPLVVPFEEVEAIGSITPRADFDPLTGIDVSPWR